MLSQQLFHRRPSHTRKDSASSTTLMPGETSYHRGQQQYPQLLPRTDNHQDHGQVSTNEQRYSQHGTKSQTHSTSRPGHRQSRFNGHQSIEATKLLENLYVTGLPGFSDYDEIFGPPATHANEISRILASQKIVRPATPPDQINQGSQTNKKLQAQVADLIAFFPPTPLTLPVHQTRQVLRQSQSRTAQSSPTRHGHAKKPSDFFEHGVFMKRGHSNQEQENWFDTLLEEQDRLPSPPNTAPLPSSDVFEPFSPQNTGDFSLDSAFPSIPAGSVIESSISSPMTERFATPESNSQSSPEMRPNKLFGEVSPDFIPSVPSSPQKSKVSSPRKSSPRKSKAQSAQVTKEDIEEEFNCKVLSTGITDEDIVEWIKEAPKVVGGKPQFICTFVTEGEGDCNKSFDRQENIRSHIQTHLEDRRFSCNVCGNRFVRIHDMKRHSLIHSGKKDCVCKCGKGFTRSDALQRHRQRNSCVGAVDPSEMKTSKRGRPKKSTGDTPSERREKKMRTRKEVTSKSYSSASSIYSHPSPVAEEDWIFDSATTMTSSEVNDPNANNNLYSNDCFANSPEAIMDDQILQAHQAMPLPGNAYGSNHGVTAPTQSLDDIFGPRYSDDVPVHSSPSKSAFGSPTKTEPLSSSPAPVIAGSNDFAFTSQSFGDNDDIFDAAMFPPLPTFREESPEEKSNVGLVFNIDEWLQ